MLSIQYFFSYISFFVDLLLLALQLPLLLAAFLLAFRAKVAISAIDTVGAARPVNEDAGLACTRTVTHRACGWELWRDKLCGVQLGLKELLSNVACHLELIRMAQGRWRHNKLLNDRSRYHWHGRHWHRRSCR